MKRIELHNYKCFQSLELDFKEGVNLLVGDNASGKTTLLQAIRSAMSAFFSGYSDEYTRFLGLSKRDFTQIDAGDVLVNEPPVQVCFDYSDYLGNEGFSDIRMGCLALSGTVTKGMKEYKEQTKELQMSLFEQNMQVQALPLLASFSTGDIHYTRKLSAKNFTKYLHKPSFGYYECLQGDGLFAYWIKRLLVLVEGGRGVMKFPVLHRQYVRL